EYIIIDGASTDDTLTIINQHSRNVSTVISEPDKGIYDALNKGISVATGDVIGFLHSDDIFASPNVITDVVDIFNNTMCDAVYGDLEYVAKDDVNKVIRRWTGGNVKKSRMKFGWMPAHPTFYMKRDIYKKLGCFDLNFKISADYDSLVRYIELGSISLAYNPKVMIRMRVGGMSNRSLSNIILKSKEDIRIMKNTGFCWPIAFLYKNLSKLPQFLK
ncbi:TPA: glycosyltransferase, partial [Yersinia enterocolitica]|nr:glycosyltransferase [Yersinia enterocolitica]